MKYIAEYMRSHEQRYYKFKNQPFHFTYTQTKVEKPINIIIQKTLLLSLACRVYDVTKDNLKLYSSDEVKALINA